VKVRTSIIPRRPSQQKPARRNTVNKSFVGTLIIGTLVSLATLASCSQSAPVTPAVEPTTEAAGAEARIRAIAAHNIAVTPLNAVSDEERLNSIQSSIGWLVAESLEHGLVVSEDIFNTVQAIERAKETLRQLDGQRDGLQMLVVQNGELGTSPPEYVFELMHAVDEARLETLKRFGLNP
jgi:hypothetical protein